MHTTLQNLHPNASLHMVAPARILLEFHHPEIRIDTHHHVAEDFLVACAQSHNVSARVVIGQHSYRLAFSAYNKNPQFGLELSRGRLNEVDLVKLAGALVALADLGRAMSLSVDPSYYDK